MSASHNYMMDIGPWGIPGTRTYCIGKCVGAPQHNRTIWSLCVDNKTPVASHAPLNRCQEMCNHMLFCWTLGLGTSQDQEPISSGYVLGHPSTMELSGHCVLTTKPQWHLMHPEIVVKRCVITCFSVGHWALGHPRTRNLFHQDMCWGTPAQWNYLVIVCWQQNPSGISCTPKSLSRDV